MSATPGLAGMQGPTGFPGEEPAILEVDDVSADYGAGAVLREVSFDVRRGSITALLGPNGCGKTTLLRIIGRLHAPAAGSVRVEGRDVAHMRASELSRVLASVAQVQRTTFPFSVLDILLTGRLPYVSTFAAPGADDVALCREVLDRFGIRHLERQAVTALSGGERQLVMVARALAQQPRVLLLDEPTTFLDLRNQERVLGAVSRLARADGLTVLMTIHDPNQALGWADRAVLLRRLAGLEGDPAAGADGLASTVAAGDPDDVLSPANVRLAYGVEMDRIEHARRRLLVPAS